MEFINQKGHVAIVHDGRELGTLYYGVRRGRGTLPPAEILIEAGNLITVTFAGARFKDEFIIIITIIIATVEIYVMTR